ncbi:G1/S-specific cyclin-E1 [Labeo rohita]|uniref:G1/S-specific cyclin-E1 n=1 Tax=Labeo rohita TaxID=84645 RepID=A0ABQ8L855_LABRO|nr:G1/S-specific cyclin-E1 [Labeo rohita]
MTAAHKHKLKSRPDPLSSSTVIVPPFILLDLLHGTRDQSRDILTLSQHYEPKINPVVNSRCYKSENRITAQSGNKSAEKKIQQRTSDSYQALSTRAAFFSKKPWLTATASRSGPSTSGYEAGAMCMEEEREELCNVLPGASPQAASPACSPMECSDDFESSSQYGLDLLFGAPAEEKAGSAASEGGREASEADAAAELTALAAECQSVADAEMAAALQRAAKEIGVVWVPPPSPEPSRLDDWCLGVDEIMESPSVGSILIYQLPVPHHPRWRSGEGVYGGPPGGESGCDALVPAKRHLLEGTPETPVRSVFICSCSKGLCDPWSSCIRPGDPDPELLQELHSSICIHLSASTLKVHVAAISANHDMVGGRLVGKHDLVIRFLRGARRLNPPRPHLIPSWDLAVVLQGLQQDPFEPFQSVELNALSLKIALLTVLTSVKRVDLQALFINSSCSESSPRPRYMPKVPTTPFRDQVVTLQAISSQENDPNLTLLCPVCALRIYMERTQPFRRSEQLCYGEQQKQRISHWLVDGVELA